MTEGKILEWKVKVGDSFDVGDSLFSIETDKATVDYEATEKGVLAKIINDGSKTLPVGVPVAVFTKKKDDVEKFKDFTLESASGSTPSSQQTTTQPPQSQSQPQPTQTPPSSTSQTQSSTSSSGDRVFASPLAKTVAQQKGINLSEVQGSGPNGRILKQDVESFQPRTVQQVQQQAVQQPVVEAPKPAK